MRIVDLYCGAGAASLGYARAGFEVVGVDVVDQPNYPFEFIRADAIEYIESSNNLDGFDAAHASPPCQAHSVTSTLHTFEYPEMIEDTRARLVATGKPYVIENVVGAPLVDAIMLCGSSFGLGVRRHRLFEIRPMPLFPPPCAHHLQPEPIDVTGTGGQTTQTRPTAGPERGGTHRKPRDLAHAFEVMGVPQGSMTRRELSEAVPPAYTEWVGSYLADVLTGAGG